MFNYNNGYGYNNQNNGFNNGFNNNFNNNFNNYNMNNAPVDTVYHTLTTLNSLILMADRNEIRKEELAQGIEDLQRQNRLTIVGQGTNRIVIQVNGDMSKYTGRSEECVIKIPYALDKGINDNYRELLLYDYLTSIANTNRDPEVRRLVETLPWVTQVNGFAALTAQEKVLSIENYVRQKYPNVSNENILSESKIVLLDQFKEATTSLLSLLDTYCIVADLNPLATPLQYGFKIVNGRYILTVLDTGYSIPKFPELLELYNGGILKERKYLVLGRDIELILIDNGNGAKTYKLKSLIGGINENFINLMANSLNTSGIYLDTVLSYNADVKDSYCIDMAHFTKVYESLKQLVRNNMFNNVSPTPLSIYFATLSESKNLNARVK